MPTLVDCPQSNFGEWDFYLFGAPVRVKIWFWLACLVTCYGRETTSEIVIWFAVCLGSVLLHEMGHVVALRRYRIESDVVLYGFGGLTIPERTLRGTVPRLLVSLAGPAAGFCVAALVAAAARLSGAHIVFAWRTLVPTLGAVPPSGPVVADTATFVWYVFLNTLLSVNFYWGLINLLPIYPLDGGQVSRAIFEKRDPSAGRRKSLILSTASAIAIALVGVLERDGYLIILFAVLAVASLQAYEQERR
jgi:stage IV sporulation protein FB